MAWKDVKGYEGLYQVSDKGEVYALPRVVHNGRGSYVRKGQYISPKVRGRKDSKYRFVVLSDGKNVHHAAVHRMVAEAFIENPLGFDVINHKDKNTFNNSVENLEWCDQQYNNEYSHNLKVGQYKDGHKISDYKSIKYASQITGINRRAINNALKGWSMSAGGYEWRYEEGRENLC